MRSGADAQRMMARRSTWGVGGNSGPLLGVPRGAWCSPRRRCSDFGEGWGVISAPTVSVVSVVSVVPVVEHALQLVAHVANAVEQVVRAVREIVRAV